MESETDTQRLLQYNIGTVPYEPEAGKIYRTKAVTFPLKPGVLRPMRPIDSRCVNSALLTQPNFTFSLQYFLRGLPALILPHFSSQDSKNGSDFVSDAGHIQISFCSPLSQIEHLISREPHSPRSQCSLTMSSNSAGPC